MKTQTEDSNFDSEAVLFPEEEKQTPFKRLFWYDKENDVVKICETPPERKKNKLSLAPVIPQGSPHLPENFFVPKRKLSFQDLRGKLRKDLST